MKIGFICDLHLPYGEQSVQYAFFNKALSVIRKEKPDTVICVGDIAAFGEISAIKYYFDKVSSLNHNFVLGNSDVRDVNTVDEVLSLPSGFSFDVGDRKILGVDTPFAKFDENAMSSICSLKDGDVLIIHHSVRGLLKESRDFLNEQLEQKALTVIHAHTHAANDYNCGRSRIIEIRALDPDKSIGNFPCVTFFEITDSDITYYEKLLAVENSSILSLRDYFGLSCLNNAEDLRFAIEHNVKRVELRCGNNEIGLDEETCRLAVEWKRKTGGYLSIHMPNLCYYADGLKGENNWKNAIALANLLNADALTMHPPRVSVELIKSDSVKNELLQLYAYAVNSVAPSVKIGIENLHLKKGENEMNRDFGYTPDEVSFWIDEINKILSNEGRVGHVLDVGHARNNGVFAQRFPIGKWYACMGGKTIGYHIHQVVRANNEFSNHKPIEDWFGPMISYASFFYCWKHNVLNHVPIFLEVKGYENFKKSIDAFMSLFDLSEN